MRLRENKRLQRDLSISVFWLIVIYIGITVYLVFFLYPAEVNEWKDKYQVESQKRGECLKNFETIAPQLKQKVIHIYPYSVREEELERVGDIIE